MTLSPNANAILSRLRMYHMGRKRGVTCASLAGAAGIRERNAREAITELRLAGFPVCGLPSTGYFIAETPAELEETARFHETRGKHSLHLASRLRNVPLGQLMGQLKLDWEGK